MHENKPMFLDIAKKLNDYYQKSRQTPDTRSILDKDTIVCENESESYASGQVACVLQKTRGKLFGPYSIYKAVPRLVVNSVFDDLPSVDGKEYFLHRSHPRGSEPFGFYKSMMGLDADPNLHAALFKRIVPAVFDVTGVCIQAVPFVRVGSRSEINSAAQDHVFEIVNEDTYYSLAALVDYHDDLRETQVKINKEIIHLAKVADNIIFDAQLRKTHYSFLKLSQMRIHSISTLDAWQTKGEALAGLAKNLKEITEEFFINYRSFRTFKIDKAEFSERYKLYVSEFNAACEQAKALDVHRGNARLIAHSLASLIFGIGLLTGLVDALSFYTRGKYFWRDETDSRKETRQLRTSVMAALEQNIEKEYELVLSR